MNLLRIHSRRLLLLCLLVLMPTRSILAQAASTEDDAATASQLDRLMQSYHDAGLFNGVALVGQDERVLFQRGYGFANMQWRVPNDVDTRMAIASLTKPMTATLIMRLAQEGLVDLDATVGTYVPELDPRLGQRVRIHHLLNHTSGLQRDILEGTELRVSHSQSELLEIINKGQLHFEPGTKWAYCNVGYFLLTIVAERVTGEPFDRLMMERVLKPAGMHDAGNINRHNVMPRLANGYVVCAGEFFIPDVVAYANIKGGAGVYTTVGDLFRWDQALNGNTLLSAESKRRMFDPGEHEYGYGWFIKSLEALDDDDSVELIWHGGYGGGFYARMYRIPEERTVVILLSNQSELPSTQILDDVRTILGGGEPTPVGPPVGQQIFRLILNEGIEPALCEFRRIQDSDYKELLPIPMLVHNQGAYLEEFGRAEDAELIYEFNVKAYPEHWIGHLQMSQVLWGRDRKDEAIAHLRMLAEVDPGNRYLPELLSEMDIPAEAGIAELAERLRRYDTFAGRYVLTSDRILEIERSGSRLMVTESGQEAVEASIDKDNSFTIAARDVRLSFVSDADGKATQIVWSEGGVTTTGRRDDSTQTD